MGDGVVDAALMVDVQGGPDQVHERGPELAERADGALTVFDGSGVAAGHGDGRPEVQLVVDDRQRRDRAEPDDGPELVGRVGGEVPVEAQDPVVSSAAQNTGPAMTVGPTGCSANRNELTTPKFPPPPRRAQNRSG